MLEDINISIGIFEDNPAISVGLSCYLRHEIKGYALNILYSTSQPQDFLTQTKATPPNVLIMDIIADGVLGLELFEEIFDQIDSKETIVLAYSNVKSQRVIQTLLNLGVSAYIPKTEQMEVFQKAFNSVLNLRKTYLPEQLQHLKAKKEIPIILTPMEKKIIPLLIQGASTKEIANQLHISTNTIAFHKKNLFSKFRVNNIAAFVKEAIEQGYSGGIHY